MEPILYCLVWELLTDFFFQLFLLRIFITGVDDELSSIIPFFSLMFDVHKSFENFVK